MAESACTPLVCPRMVCSGQRQLQKNTISLGKIDSTQNLGILQKGCLIGHQRQTCSFKLLVYLNLSPLLAPGQYLCIPSPLLWIFLVTSLDIVAMFASSSKVACKPVLWQLSQMSLWQSIHCPTLCKPVFANLWASKVGPKIQHSIHQPTRHCIFFLKENSTNVTFYIDFYCVSWYCTFELK